MKAIRCHEWCGPRGLTVDEIDAPEPGVGEVLVKVKTTALNFPDLLLIAGKYQVKPDFPFAPGMEVAGTVERLGEGVDEFAVGDRVMASIGRGGMAEYVAFNADAADHIPETLNDEEACAFPLVYQTSYFGLIHRAQMQPGESVLVHSAAGGVGLAAVQIARALGAGKIIGTAGSDEKLDLIKQHGADVVLNYNKEDFVEVVKRETDGRGADIIYDPVGGEVAERSTKCIAFEGRLLIIGFTSGEFSNFRSNHVLIKNYSVVGLHYGYYRKMNPAKMDAASAELFELVSAGKFKPHIGGSYPMLEWADAMEFLGSRKAVGKVVLHW